MSVSQNSFFTMILALILRWRYAQEPGVEVLVPAASLYLPVAIVQVEFVADVTDGAALAWCWRAVSFQNAHLEKFHVLRIDFVQFCLVWAVVFLVG